MEKNDRLQDPIFFLSSSNSSLKSPCFRVLFFGSGERDVDEEQQRFLRKGERGGCHRHLH